MGLLTLGAVLSAVATVKEAQGLMAGVSSLCSQMPRPPEKNQKGVKSWQGCAPPPHLSDQAEPEAPGMLPSRDPRVTPTPE